VGLACDQAVFVAYDQVIRYGDYLTEVGLVRRASNPILLIDGSHTVASMLDISRILERLKHVNGQVAALIVNVTKETAFQDIGYNAKHSAYLESFKGPVICALKGQFEFEPLAWPSPSAIVDGIPDYRAQYTNPWLEDNWWEMHASPLTTLPSITLHPLGHHHLDKHGAFPIVPVGQFEVKISWEGHEVYVGDFQEGAKHGKGIFVKANGDKHCGNYQGGVSHGAGAYHWKNGTVWLGTWLHGRNTSKGEMRTRGMQEAALLLQCNFRMSQARQELEAHAQRERRSKQERVQEAPPK